MQVVTDLQQSLKRAYKRRFAKAQTHLVYQISHQNNTMDKGPINHQQSLVLIL